jgi:3-phenylpropionate/trans-cinnamate dioxygenase ferredoxin subunit
MATQEICKPGDIPLGGKKAFTIGDEKVLVFHTDEGFFATQSRCTHLFWSLESGKMQGCNVQCPLHHAQFDVRTGEVVKWANFPPGIQLLNAVRAEKALQTWPVRVEGESVLITL